MFLVILAISVPSFVFAAVGQLLIEAEPGSAVTLLPGGGLGHGPAHAPAGARARARHDGVPHPAHALVAARDRPPGLRADRAREGPAADAASSSRTSSATRSSRSSPSSGRRSRASRPAASSSRACSRSRASAGTSSQAVQQLDYTVIMGTRCSTARSSCSWSSSSTSSTGSSTRACRRESAREAARARVRPDDFAPAERTRAPRGRSRGRRCRTGTTRGSA